MSEENPETNSSPPPEEAGEEVLFEAHPAMFRARPFTFIAGVAAIIGSGVGTVMLLPGGLLAIAPALVGVGVVIAMLAWWLQCKRTTLTVTDSRTRLRRGLISVHLTEVWHNHVRNVKVSQGVKDRIFGVGTIGIASAGKSDYEIKVSGMRKLHDIKDKIDQNRQGLPEQTD